MTVLVGTVSLKSSVKEPQREALEALAADILAGPPEEDVSRLEALDSACTARNLSPGGSADLLAAALLLERGVRLTCRIVPGGEHCEASWEKQIPFFIETLMYELNR